MNCQPDGLDLFLWTIFCILAAPWAIAFTIRYWIWAFGKGGG